MRYLFIALASLGLTSSLTTQPPSKLQAQPPSKAQIKALVQQALDHWQVPGAAVAIIHNDKLYYLEGFGVKEKGKLAPVTPDTVFPIASCSKTLTVTLMAMLVDDGKIWWDDPVRKHLPWFRLADPLADLNVTLRDLLTHRTGLNKHEPLWYKTQLTMEERAKRLQFLEPTFSFRAHFEYQATAYGTAGLAAAQAAKAPWEDLMQKRVFKPLDMKTASAVYPGAAAVDLASPHKLTARGVVNLERYPLDIPDPAGTVHASARDLSKFLQFILRGGVTPEKKRLVSTDSLIEILSSQMVIPRKGLAIALNPQTNVLNYTLGWVAQDYRGKWMLLHGGTVDGFRVQLTLVPEAKLAIVMLNNLDRTWMNFALSNTLVDRFCELPNFDWNKYCESINDEVERITKQSLNAILKSQRKGTNPSLKLEDYAGKYFDPAYGTCEIQVVNGKLHWQWGKVQTPLEHFHFDTFLSKDDPIGTLALTFQLTDTGFPATLRVMERNFRRLP